MSSWGMVLVCAAALLTTAANLLMRVGIERAGGFSGDGAAGYFESLARLMLEPRFVTGVFLYALASLAWFRVVASEPLSVAYPVLVSITFACVTIGAVAMLGEQVGAAKLAGLLLIASGVVLVARSG
jgi:multidrug transporter EmrE-like cation transporter